MSDEGLRGTHGTEGFMKVLLAVDNSTFYETATQAVIDQSQPKETEVRVLHVIEPLLAAYGGL